MDWLGPTGQLAALGTVALVFLLLATLELVAPKRASHHSKPRRWMTNLGLFAIDTALVRLAVPLLMVGTALMAQERGWGLLNQIALPGWVEFAAAILLLDLALYVQHVATHRIPILWRLHKVHHADPDFDITTGARFHPLEIVLSMGYKMAVVALLGPAALAVFAFELLFNLGSMFSHTNIALPARIEPLVRALLVTPDMHRVHHSVAERETNSNYGTVLSGWDRLFGTYRRDPAAGADGVTIGLGEYQDARPTGLIWSLLLPFRK